MDPIRPYVDPTLTLHRPHIDPTSTPHRLHIDSTSTSTNRMLYEIYYSKQTCFIDLEQNGKPRVPYIVKHVDAF